MDEINVQFPSPTANLTSPKRRRNLLPWWVVAFTWLFLLSFALIPVAIIMGLLRYNFQISLLGLSTNDPISLTGGFLILLFSFKGVIAFALWTEKTWAVRLARIDALLSIVICFLVMGYHLFDHSFSMRLEPIALFPYYFKMSKIQYDWENFGSQETMEF